MFQEPSRENYSSYGDYALAVFGFAILGSDYRPAVIRDAGVHRLLDCVHSGGVEVESRVAGPSGSRTCQTGGCGLRVQSDWVPCCGCRGGGCTSSPSGDSVTGEVPACAGSSSSFGEDGVSGGLSGSLFSGGAASVCREGVVESKLERNRRWRCERKEKKKKRQSMNEDWRKRSPGFDEGYRKKYSHGSSEVSSLRVSLEEKWRVKNELETERAKRQLAVLRANSVDQEVKRYRTRVSADTEKNMVSIEKTHAMLSATGNVPEVFHGSAATVISEEPGLSDGSISPNSSASMAEFRAVQKECADLKHVVELFEKNFKVSAENVKYYDKDVWTENEANEAILDELYPDGYGMNPAYTPEGKFQVC